MRLPLHEKIGGTIVTIAVLIGLTAAMKPSFAADALPETQPAKPQADSLNLSTSAHSPSDVRSAARPS